MTTSFQKLKNTNAFTLFLVKALVFYGLWWFTYNIVFPRYRIDEYVIAHQVNTSGNLLEKTGYNMQYSFSGTKSVKDILWINGSGRSLQVEKACDSVDLMGLFAVFILAYPGRWKHRAWFIPAGMLLIHVLNILRICALVIIEYKHHDWLEFNHKYTFTALMYLFIFGMWYVWVSYFSRKK